MESFLLVIGLITLGHLLFTLIECFIGFKLLTNLQDQSILPLSELPSLTIILSALNEESTIETGVRSLLNQHYPKLNVIAINDRSSDNTPHILERLQKEYSMLSVYHIHALPENWLGKNHALQYAAERAQGEWILFTDADVTMKPETLLRSISYALTKQLKHLTIYEHHIRKHFWLKVLLLGSYTTYAMALKPWRVRARWSKKYLGHGAFNLVEKAAYMQSGGHSAIAMECLDDVKLGQLIKTHGFKQDTVNGQSYVEREWYTSTREMIEGLKKNSFAYFDYQSLLVLRDISLTLVYFIWPIVAIACYSGAVRWVNMTNISLSLLLNVSVAQHFRLAKRYALLYPVSILMLLYTICNSVATIYFNNGVVWRGTHYPLKKLKSFGYKHAR